MPADCRDVPPVLGVQLVLRTHVTNQAQEGKTPRGLALGNVFIGSEITRLRRAGMSTALRRATRGFARGQTCYVGSAGGLPGPSSRQRLGTWHLAPCITSVGLALWPPCRWAPRFPVAGVVSLSQCGGWGSGVGTSPGCKQAPSTSPSWALGSYSSGARRALPLFSPPVGAWQSWRGPHGLSGTSSGQTLEGTGGWGESSSQGPAQDTASEPP